MIDGVEENDVWLNWAYLSRQYPISNIKAVEVVYGPTGTMYGPRAFVGAINIITFPPGERAGDFFKQREARNSDIYANINVAGGSFNTKDLDITIGNTMAKSKIKYQVTGRFYRSDEHDEFIDTFYDYDAAGLDGFQYDHIVSTVAEAEASTGKSIDQLRTDYGSYFVQSGDNLSLSSNGITRAREADVEAYTRSINGVPLQPSNHTDIFFIGAKLAFGNFLIGLEYIFKQSGPMTMGASQVCGFIKSDSSRATPNLQFHVQPISTDILGASKLHDFHGTVSYTHLTLPTSDLV
mgnify:CR=1 FL=1